VSGYEELCTIGVIHRAHELWGGGWCGGRTESVIRLEPSDDSSQMREWKAGQREENAAAIRECRPPRNYHGPDGLTSCGGGCCDGFARGERMVT
jgi:hypothetical protein